MAGPAGVPEADDAAPPTGPEAVRLRTATAVVATQVVVSAVAVFAGVAAVVERQWLEGRAAWIALLAGVVPVGLWGADRRWGAAGGAALAGVATVVAMSAADRTGDGFSFRVLSDDLPPLTVYAVTLASALCCLGCLGIAVAAWWRRERLRPGPLAGLTGRETWRSVGSGLLVAAVLLPTILLGGGLSRAIADHGAAALSGPAEGGTLRHPAQPALTVGGRGR